jgi:hypothetical protein
MVFIDLSPGELGEVTAKLANELEVHKSEVPEDLAIGFMTLYQACQREMHVCHTTLMTKWAAAIRDNSHLQKRIALGSGEKMIRDMIARRASAVRRKMRKHNPDALMAATKAVAEIVGREPDLGLLDGNAIWFSEPGQGSVAVMDIGVTVLTRDVDVTAVKRVCDKLEVQFYDAPEWITARAILGYDPDRHEELEDREAHFQKGTVVPYRKP